MSATDTIRDAGSPVAARSGGALFWARFRDDRLSLVAGGVVALLVLVALVGGPLAENVTGHPSDTAYNEIMLDEFGVPKGPNADFWLGADVAGRDLLVRIAYGARTSLMVGVVAAGAATLIGLVVGLVAGFFRGPVDAVLSRVTDVVLALPALLLAIGVVAACGTTKEGCRIGSSSLGFNLTPGTTLVIVVIALFAWPQVARVVRGLVLSLREREFVEASRSLGAGNVRIMTREIGPNLIGPVVVYATLLVPQCILFEAALSFLGVGIPVGTPSWGVLLGQASVDLWWLVVFPGLALVITTLAFNLLGDGLRDALDVRSGR